MSTSTHARILYLEPNRGLAALPQKKLEQSGYAVDVVDNGRDGLARHAAHPYDVIAVDYRLPNFGGLAVIKSLAAGNTLPATIIMTAEGDEAGAIEGIRQGATDYIIKDRDLRYVELLPTVVAKVLTLRRLQREREQMIKIVQERNQALALLNKVSYELTSILNLNEVMERLMGATIELLGTEGCSLWLWGRDRTDLVCQAVIHKTGTPPLVGVRVKVGQGGVGWVAATSQTAVIQDTSQDERFNTHIDDQIDFHTRSLMAVPLCIEDEFIGVLEVVNKLEGEFEDEDLALANALAASAATAIENARRFESLREQKVALEARNEQLDFFAHRVTLERARSLNSPQAIARWADEMKWLSTLNRRALISPTFILFSRLREIALEAKVAVESISQLNRSAALGRALAMLTQLIDDVDELGVGHTRPLVKDIAQQWRDVLSLTAGEIGRQAIHEPIANPFIVGNPVQGALFVGREDIFRQLEDLWGSAPKRSVDSVVLYGHRRMGKTSILQNMGLRFGVETIVAQFTMQRAGRVRHTGELLANFALAIYDAVEDARALNMRGPAHATAPELPEPQFEAYEHNWTHTFNRFLRLVKQVIGSRRVILTIDEFELIEEAIDDGRVEAEVLAYLRGVIHSEPWLILALAGLHTLQEMTADYWSPLFASVHAVRVSFLSPAESEQLLANPSKDFPLDMTRETVDYVYSLANGQPYLTQLIGHSLVRRYNRRVFEEHMPDEPRFLPADVDAVVNSHEFYEQGSYYFTGIWGQAEKDGPVGQIPILRALARAGEPVSGRALLAQTGSGMACLEALIQHDVIRAEQGLYDFAVPLMRYWIMTFKLKNAR